MVVKRIVGILIFFGLFVFIGLFFSCKLPSDTMSIQERVDQFVSDIDGERYSVVYKHCHPDAVDYNTGAKTSGFWQTIFLNDAFSIASNAPTGSVVSTNVTSGVFNGDLIEFEMLEDGADNWKIRKLTIAGDPKFE